MEKVTIRFFELAAKVLASELKIIAPWRELNINSREDAIAYACAHNVPVEQTTKNIYSPDSNIWHLSDNGGVLEDPTNAPEESMCAMGSFPASHGCTVDAARRNLVTAGRN